jgi:hypothetical protein
VAESATEATPKKADKLLKRLSLGKSVADACRFQKINRSTYYRWRDSDPDFKQAADDAIEDGTDLLEDYALQRALDGESDTLAIFLLKGRRREKYGDRVDQRHAAHDGGPLTLVINRPPAAE